MKKIAVAILALAALAFAGPASAQLRVDVTQGNIQPLPIAIPDFIGDPQGAQIAGVVRADLDRSGLFRPLDPKSFVDQVKDINTVPNFANWRVINAQALVTGQVQAQPDGRLRLDFRLWDVASGSQMVGLQYYTTPDNWRRIAHIISDQIYERLETGKGTDEDIQKLLDISDTILGKSFCALGDGAASPVMSSIKFFRDEYVAHVEGVGCPFDPRDSMLTAERDGAKG